MLIGFLLGLQHAVEADHLAAVSTIVSEKKSLWSASIVGGLWGLGHTLSLLLAGGLVIFFKLQISETTEARLEAIVGIMLVILGINALRKLRSAKKIHIHAHEHGERKHSHLHTHSGESESDSHHSFSPRSVIIGMVHGLAGSAALMLLIVPTIPSSTLAISYILVFGIGSIGGMMVMSFVLGLPLYFTATRFNFANTAIRFCAGAFSLALGLLIVYQSLST